MHPTSEKFNFGPLPINRLAGISERAAAHHPKEIGGSSPAAGIPAVHNYPTPLAPLILREAIMTTDPDDWREILSRVTGELIQGEQRVAMSELITTLKARETGTKQDRASGLPMP